MLSSFVATMLLCLATVTTSQPIAALAYPGNLFFAAQNINAVAKAEALQKANNQYANHVDSNSGNNNVQKLLVVDKNHANQEANSNGFQNAEAANNALQKRNSNIDASGAVLAPWIGRQLLRNGGYGGCGGGIGCGPLVPSSLLTAKKNLNAENAANTFNQANQGQEADARQHADTHHRVKSDIIQNGYANANAMSKAQANALAKSNFFSKQNANEAQAVVANPGLFLRR